MLACALSNADSRTSNAVARQQPRPSILIVPVRSSFTAHKVLLTSAFIRAMLAVTTTRGS